MKMSRIALSLAALDAFGQTWKESKDEKPE